MSPPRSGIARRSENSIWLLAKRQAALAQGGVHGAGLLGRVVRHPDRAHKALGVGGGQRLGQGVVRAQRDRAVDLVEVDHVDPQPLPRLAGGRQQRGAHVELPRARHELRRDDEAVAHGRVGGEQATDDPLALAAAVDLGRVEEDDARRDARFPGLADGRFREGLVVATHAPRALVAPGPRPDAERRDGDIGAGQLDAVDVPGRRGVVHGVAHCAVVSAAAQARWASTAARHSAACVSWGEW